MDLAAAFGTAGAEGYLNTASYCNGLWTVGREFTSNRTIVF